jgi:phosphatidate cytidylyltransferase
MFGDYKRILTGIGLIATVLLIGVIDNFYLTWLLLGIAFMFAFHEAMKLFGVLNSTVYFYAAVLWLVAAFYPNPDDLALIVLMIYASMLAYSGEFDKKLFLLFLYPTLSFLFLLTLYNDFGMMALLWILVVVAGSDIGAYFTGKAVGKTPFSPTSPNKTIEGVVGGVITGVVMGGVVGMHFVALETALLISFFVSVASIFGDLYESYLKRQAGVKDSGSLFPGHGGMLDRVDGYLFGGVVLVIMLRGIA